jgi:hypothetical protein
VPVEASGIELKQASNGMNLNKLKELKAALEEGLISASEYEEAKKKFLGV